MTGWYKIGGIFLLGALTNGYVGCNASNPGPTGYVTLRINQSARISSGVTVRVDSIQDSRCPKNVQCIWAGQASVKATLSEESYAAPVRLVLGGVSMDRKRLDSTGVTLGAQVYSVVLRSVQPYPETFGSPDQEAVIEVTKH